MSPSDIDPVFVGGKEATGDSVLQVGPVTFLKGDGFWKSTEAELCVFSSLSSPIALPLSGLGVYVFAADWPSIRDHTPLSGGDSAGEGRGRIG